MSILALSILAIWFWRFKDTPIDRDFCPYAYPALNGTGYLESGHTDIKPPLIHWSYKCGTKIISLISAITPRTRIETGLRLLPFLGMSLAVLSLSVASGGKSTGAPLALALLLASPSLWAHMANTEWMTVTLWAVAIASPSPSLAWAMLGLTPLVNLKNVLLLVPVAWALGLLRLPISLDALWLFFPGALALLYLLATGRLKKAWKWTVTVPGKMGQARTLRINTLQSFHLLKPGLYVFAPFLASMDYSSPWFVIACGVVAVAVWSKQIVPHHYILLALPVSMAWEPSFGSLLAFALVFVLREVIPYLKPSAIYAVTFAGRQGGDYGLNLQDGAWASGWLETHTKSDETVWINGWENQIYLTAQRKAWQIQVPELTELPEGEPPRVIIHCQGAIPFDYDKHGYTITEITPNRALTILTRA